jgi:hypothetical protein
MDSVRRFVRLRFFHQTMSAGPNRHVWIGLRILSNIVDLFIFLIDSPVHSPLGVELNTLGWDISNMNLKLLGNQSNPQSI